jgi:hypothetical protein
MNTRLKGLREVQAAFDAKLKEIQGYTAEALTDVAFSLLGDAVLLAPVDTGDLRGSGFVEIDGKEVAHGVPRKGNKEGKVAITGNAPNKTDMTATIGFATPYAVRQHEELEYRHPQGGQAKYLEQPFKENADKYIKHLAASVRKAVD